MFNKFYLNQPKKIIADWLLPVKVFNTENTANNVAKHTIFFVIILLI